MQIICPISGIKLLKSDYLLGEDYSDVCPIFRKPRSKLIVPDTAFKFSNAKSEIEKKLYFLAVCNCTDLITFQTIANPSQHTVEKNFYHAFSLAGWMDYALFATGKSVSFPHYIVRKDTETMENIGEWLNAIEEIREAILKKETDRELVFRLNKNNQELQRELTNAVLKDRMFTPRLVNWLFEQSGLEDHPKEALFRRTLLTQVKEAGGISVELISEIHDLLVENFGYNHPMAIPIYGQLHAFKEQIKKGIADFQILDEEYSRIEDGEVIVSRAPIAEVYEQKFIAEFGSMQRPKREDFPTRGGFLVADAKWTLAQKKVKADAEQKLSEEVKEHFSELNGLTEEIAEEPESDTDETDGEEDANL